MSCNATEWTQVGRDLYDYANNANDGEGDRFGWDVALSADGNVMAVTAPMKLGGYVRVYRKGSVGDVDSSSESESPSIRGWTQLGRDLVGSDDDRFGYAVDLSSDGTVIAIGAVRKDGTNKRPKSNIFESSYSYETASTSTSTLAMPSTRKNMGPLSESGSVQVYQWDESDTLGVWKQVGRAIFGEARNDWFGVSVSLSSDASYLAIGAIWNNGATGDVIDSGHVRIYRRDPSSKAGWDQVGSDLDGEARFDTSGRSVALSRDGLVVAIGAPYNDGNNAIDSGHVRVYEYDKESPLGWRQVGHDLDGESAGDEAGYSLSLSADGLILAVGSYRHNGNETSEDDGNYGSVRVYQRADMTDLGWIRIGEDIKGIDANENFGYTVSLSARGDIVAIGSNQNAVRVYARDTSVSLGWRLLDTFHSESIADDTTGFASTALSSDGEVLLVGYPYTYGGSGSVQVYQACNTTFEEESSLSTTVDKSDASLGVGKGQKWMAILAFALFMM